MTSAALRYLAALDRFWLALATTVAFFLTALLLGHLTPAFDARHQAVSALSLGPLGWMQDLGFVAVGITLLWSVPAWRFLLAPGRAGTAFPVLTGVIGVSFLLFPLLPQDPAPGYDPAGLQLTHPTLTGLLHLAVAGVAVLAQVAGLMVMARRFRQTATWRSWSVPTVAVAVAMIVCVAVYAVWSVQPTGFAGTFERLAILLPAVWAWAVLRRLATGALPP